MVDPCKVWVLTVGKLHIVVFVNVILEAARSVLTVICFCNTLGLVSSAYAQYMLGLVPSELCSVYAGVGTQRVLCKCPVSNKNFQKKV